MKPVRIVVIAKAPLPGLAKTRLIPALGAEGAARLARAMLLHTLEAALAARVGTVELCVTPDPGDAAWATLPVPPVVRWSAQGGGDLGERMARASQRVVDGGEAIMLMGSDCPFLTADRIREAARALRHAKAAMVPTFDGGYALLGLSDFAPSLFDGIAWSTATVASETLERLRRLAWPVVRCQMQHDIDEPADLRHLPDAWRVGPNDVGCGELPPMKHNYEGGRW
ncbi:TIGR04282 family arsenosugar biosynthesis glycosyltransferase [Duganella sp. FT3S]|uniref:TIGR04282 family arsenosugar biosynthesis glycosyltransferase n=1 Tax=Rugamonas fusca TaxID=2758568 RepID=A0A7W2EE60_9BURK|nr:TIGR04282 family arsenosugar biosynthesis glycosyltransferase [Rugamonas fusca]MBA5604196.1 TIGR04282 family arsenosugar biosynthesis glycosyltransferase [Rugamonas fusca]